MEIETSKRLMFGLGLFPRHGIAHGMLDVLVPKPSVQGAGVVTRVRERKAAAIAEHVKVHREEKDSALANAGKQAVKGLGRHWSHRARTKRRAGMPSSPSR
jgi:hypothetical protein